MKKLNDIIEYFREKEGWDYQELINDTAMSLKLIDLSPDEIWVDGMDSGEEDGCDLDTFLKAYTDKILEGVCNVVESFKE